MTAKVQLVLEHADGTRKTFMADGALATTTLLEAADDLVTTYETGEHQLPKGLYALIGEAFFATPESVKKRLFAATYGKSSAEPMLQGRTWRVHLEELLEHIRAQRWLAAVRLLTLLQQAVLDEAPR